MSAGKGSRDVKTQPPYAITFIAILACTLDPARAEIVIHEPGFAVDVLVDQIDSRTPRLEAIRSPNYGDGFGVMTAAIDNGVLTVLLITPAKPANVYLFAQRIGFADDQGAKDIRFDTTALFDSKLYISVTKGGFDTQFYGVEPDGSIGDPVATFGGSENQLAFVFDFTGGSKYQPGAYLEDTDGGHGTSLWHMDAGFRGEELAPNLLPPGRHDMDVRGMEFDTTGVYWSRLTIADSDPNNDNLCAIYQLLTDPQLSWEPLTDEVPTQQRFYRDMTIAIGGAFGQTLYAIESVSDTIVQVDANGSHETFASGFDFSDGDFDPASITVSDDGNNLYVSDENGIYRIRPAEIAPGPTIVMREPKVVADDVHTGASGVRYERILFNEPIIFSEDDITITDSQDQPVLFDVQGSNTQFMIISFVDVLLNNIYTITIADTVVSADDQTPIDGDNNGEAGGNAVIVMEHRCRADIDDSSAIGTADLLELLGNWGPCPK
jgi:hypothetical protein